ncbi:hypothetical protein HDU98_010144 [Podochytrium sp. JEL0797]|nr:hypothetical protein HDU98_010144 [Podochytrium sp. JEL0797]
MISAVLRTTPRRIPALPFFLAPLRFKTTTSTPTRTINPKGPTAANGLRNGDIPFKWIELDGPGKTKHGNILLSEALKLVQGTLQDIVVATAAKLLASPKNQDLLPQFPHVYLVGHGIIETPLALARLESGQDLVLLTIGSVGRPMPPAAKIVDRAQLLAAVELGKKAYKKPTAAASSGKAPAVLLAHKQIVKDIEIKTAIGTNDLSVKIKKCGDLLRKGYSVQLKLNDTLKSSKKAAEVLASVKAGLTESGFKFDVTENAKPVKAVVPGKEVGEDKDKYRKLYMIRAK